ncbi:nSTAND1 domain-containing NTPase [Marinigracilibium pacificum]|uniref:Novel STAND NTPase 1 domain-containing protein n=1 Tax=Marinigracilibium pacificum TaxID=2729599 RepID=A0A848IYH1_9BACT|nr:hypothetical protein [Marinigracilibium pacificum]NMM49327.1 hypothetical protein [Marinigracilibium pacificum]
MSSTNDKITFLTGERLFIPFPGLRPFSTEESHLFFGREGQSSDIIGKLEKNNFVAVVGDSGSGKSSLMYCGLIPMLQGGFIKSAGSNWDIITLRPGISPIDNLAEAVLRISDTNSGNKELFEINRSINSTILRSSSLGLVDLIRQIRKDSDRSYLIMIDQFEELFRYRAKNEHHANAINESIAFVDLFLEAINQTDQPIYVAITMRSDFIGECAQFPELTKNINESHYLIPQLSRGQKQLAIEGPISVGGGKISKRLTQQLLNDIGDTHDQLPILQHALMRTWQYWEENRDEAESIDIKHYNAVGTIKEALSLHANEAYDELSNDQKVICESLFKTITEKRGSDNFGVRRPEKLSYIASVCGCSVPELIEVVDKFREPGRSLLMPPFKTELTEESVIDISHESLMRIWIRLRNWVEEESEAAQMYLRLCDAAEKYQMGKASLLRPPDLQLALNWQEKYRPTLQWAQRYDPSFERAMVFLRTSKDEYERELLLKEQLQKRKLKRTRLAAILFSAIAVICTIFLLFALQQREAAMFSAQKALEESERAEIKEAEAKFQAQKAQQNQLRAERQTRLAKDNEEKAKAEAARNELLRIEAQEANLRLQISEAEALNEKEKADSLRILADQKREEAIQQRLKANIYAQEADFARYRAIAQSMAVKSVQTDEEDLKGLLAQQAYLFNFNYGGSIYDPYIYDGLYYASKELLDDPLNKVKGHKDAIRSIAHFNNEEAFVTAGSDGKLMLWKWNDGQLEDGEEIIFNEGVENRTLDISSDDKWLVNGTGANAIQVFNLEKIRKKPIVINGHFEPVVETEFYKGSQGIISIGLDSIIGYFDFEVFQVLHKTKSRPNSLAVNPVSGVAYIGLENGEVLKMNNVAEKPVLWHKFEGPVTALEFNSNGSLLAVGIKLSNNRSDVLLMQPEIDKQFARLRGHKSAITTLQFGQNDELLASASFDQSVLVWPINDVNQLPIVMNDHEGWVTSLKFTQGGDYLIAGTSKDYLRIRPISATIMANRMCEYLKRNFTEEEWNQFVAPDIDYEKTCGEIVQ